MMRVDICVATRKRPEGLAGLLESLSKQRVASDVDYRILVVENDAAGESKPVVEGFQRRGLPVLYDCEPRTNISLARNRAVSNSDAEWIATIDDDAIADPDWLQSLLNAAQTYQADGVFGAVERRLPSDTPRFLRDSGAFQLPNPPTGTTKNLVYNTINALFRRRLIAGRPQPFDPAFGLTGGEDTDLFFRLAGEGAQFVWCREAYVVETVFPDRANLRWLLRRAFSRRLHVLPRLPPLERRAANASASPLRTPRNMVGKNEPCNRCRLFPGRLSERAASPSSEEPSGSRPQPRHCCTNGGDLLRRVRGRMTVSVCICTRDRPRLLQAALESLLRQDDVCAEWELIVVDNGSRNRLDGVVQPFRDRLLLRLLLEPRAGLSHARNRALSAAAGRFVVFIDDDVTVSVGWLAAYVEVFERWSDAGYFGGPIIPALPDERLRARALALKDVMPGVLTWLQPDLAEGPMPRDTSLIPWGANIAFRRTAVGDRRFDPRLGRRTKGVDSGEETELIQELQADGVFGVWVPRARVEHHVGPERFSRSYVAQYCRGIGSYEGRAAALARGDGPRAKHLLNDAVFRTHRATYWKTPPWAPLKDRLVALRDFEFVKGFRSGFREAIMERSAS